MANFIKNHKEATLFLISLFTIKLLIILFLIGDRDWEPDSYMHFLQLRTVFYDFPNNLNLGINVWAKPLFTFVYGVPVSLFGIKHLILVQILNLLIFIIISFLTYEIIYKLHKSKLVALIGLCLTSLSLLTFKSSISALTEPIFTLFLVLGFRYVLTIKLNLAAMMFGISVLGRIEGLYFVGVFNIWLIYKYNISNKITKLEIDQLKTLIIAWLISVTPVIVWNFLGYLDTGRLLFIVDKGYPTFDGVFGFGAWLDYPKRLLIQEGLITVLALLSLIYLVKNYRKQKFNKEYILLAIFIYGFILSQMYLWVEGKFGSAGLMRYLISVVPFMVALGSIGMQKILEIPQLNIRLYKNKLLIVLIFASIQTAILIINFTNLGPISSKWIYIENEENLRQAGEWIRDNISLNEFVASVRPEILYYAQREGNLDNAALDFKDDLYQKRQEGFYVWTKDWGESYAITQNMMEEKGSLVYSINNYVYIYEVRGN